VWVGVLGLAVIAFGVGLWVYVRGSRESDGEGSPSRLELSIEALDLADAPAGASRLALWAKLFNPGAPTRLHGWRLEVQMGDRAEAGSHVTGQSPSRQTFAQYPPFDGTTRYEGEVTGTVYFTLPVSKQSVQTNIEQHQLRLFVKDETGKEWGTQTVVGALGEREDYEPPRPDRLG
jgi:hypothetical protein